MYKYQIRCARAYKRGDGDVFHGEYIRVIAPNYFWAMQTFLSMYMVDARVEVLPEIQA